MEKSVVKRVNIIYDSFISTSEVIGNLINAVQEKVNSDKSSHSFWYDMLKPELDKNDSDYIHVEKDGMASSMPREQAVDLLHRLDEKTSASLPFPNLILEMAFIYQVALFDAFIVDLLKLLFSRRPEILKSKKRLHMRKCSN